MSPSAILSSYPSPRFQKVAPLVADTLANNKDVLIERLNDLVQRLSTDQSLDDRVVSKLHSEVDNFEIVMIKADISQKLDKELAAGKGGNLFSERNGGFRTPKTPTRKVSISMPDSVSKSPPKKEEVNTEVATRIAQEAEALATQLSKSISDLQQRREEADVSPIIFPNTETCE
jgi:hypothetical protein